jgi:hypothetical protein
MVRLVKMLGLSVAAAAIAMAFVGTGSAPAFWPIQTLCQGPTTLCPVSYTHPLFQALSPISTDASFVSQIKEKCSNTEIEMATVEEGATETAIEIEVEKVTLSGCEPCSTVTAGGVPSIAQLINGGAEIGNGFLVMDIEVTLSSCAFGAKCTFAAKEVKLEFEGSSTEPKYLAKEEKLPLTSGTSKAFCGESSLWTASFVEKRLPQLWLVPKREYML